MNGYRKVTAMLLTAGLAVAACSPAMVLAASMPAEKIHSGYDEETWAKLNDNVVEYDEIPTLIHEFNTNIKDAWDTMEETRLRLIDNAAELESHQRKMERLKESAQNDGDLENVKNYATQEATLKGIASTMDITAGNMMKRKDLIPLQKMENQLVMVTQSVVINYDSITKQKSTLEHLQKLYDRQYQVVSNRMAQGMATEAEVLAAQNNQLSASGNIQTLEGVRLGIVPDLCKLLGWPADGNPEIAPIPPVDLAVIDGLNLEEDTRKAIGSNQELIDQRRSPAGKTNAGVDARLGVINEGDQKMTIKMQELYDDIMAKKSAYEAAQAGYQSAQKSAEGYERRYEMGLMAESDYLGGMITYYNKKAAYESADTSLRLAIETYQWAAKGLVNAD